MKIISLENNFQRMFLVTAVVLAIIGISLHNPLGGYDIPVAKQTTTPCSDGERAAYKQQIEDLKRSGIRFTDDPAKDDEYIKRMVNECINLPTGDSYGPLSEWKSTSPIVWWFGSVLNLLTYLIAVSAVGASGIAIFKEKKG